MLKERDSAVDKVHVRPQRGHDTTHVLQIRVKLEQVAQHASRRVADFRGQGRVPGEGEELWGDLVLKNVLLGVLVGEDDAPEAVDGELDDLCRDWLLEGKELDEEVEGTAEDLRQSSRGEFITPAIVGALPDLHIHPTSNPATGNCPIVPVCEPSPRRIPWPVDATRKTRRQLLRRPHHWG